MTDRVAVRVFLARILGALGGGCGIIGIITGFSDSRWKLGPEGWFLLGILGVLTALTIFFDEFRVGREQERS